MISDALSVKWFVRLTAPWVWRSDKRMARKLDPYYKLFVYDHDGSLTGGMWYVHLRQTQQMSEEAARKQGRVLGLREEREGNHREMWEAVQKFGK